MRAFGVGAFTVCICVLAGIAAHIERSPARQAPDAAPPQHSFRPVIPRTWDDAAMATLEVPLADPIGSPKHAPASYYYKMPVRPIYKSYPVYAPGHEPPGYMDWLKRQNPQIIWGVDPETGVTHTPPLKTKVDWIKAGEIVFDAFVAYNTGPFQPEFVRSPEWYAKTGVPIARDGTLPFVRWVIRNKGQVELGTDACASCHTRVMTDGTVLKGAQGSIPNRIVAFELRADAAHVKSPAQYLTAIRLLSRRMYAAPWVSPDPEARVDQMSAAEVAAAFEAVPAGMIAREGASLLYPVPVSDLIGLKDRHYLDHTGLEQQRSIVDLMRYAALNRGVFNGNDGLADYNGFIPAGFPGFDSLPDPASRARYSDAQLYALALYVYSLKPPPNPNKFDALAARGQKVFERERCTMCHTPPLYTNNKLTLAEGFTPPPGAEQKYDILPISVGTDPGLALKTRRGTGYYKVPSLKGVWYRSMFGHSGWCATLEDWFNPARLRDDYVPTGFKPYGAKTYAVKGHPFGLDLGADDKKALIAFLKTL